MIVRSAAKLVSNTASKPTRLSAAASRSSITRTPSLLLWPSSRVAGTAGATCATTTASGSARAATTSSTWSRSTIAPVGHTRAHWPQYTHSLTLRPTAKPGATLVLNPRPVKSIAPTPCTSWQTVTQRPQSTHLLGSRHSAGELMSTGCCLTAPT